MNDNIKINFHQVERGALMNLNGPELRLAAGKASKISGQGII
jgi:hypothetical protein